jgi:hypothetical protein
MILTQASLNDGMERLKKACEDAEQKLQAASQRLGEKVSKEKDRDKQWKYLMMQTDIDQSVSMLRHEVYAIGNFQVVFHLMTKQALAILDLYSKFPNMEKEKAEAVAHVDEALKGLEAVVEGAKKAIEGRESRPVPEGLYK